MGPGSDGARRPGVRRALGGYAVSESIRPVRCGACDALIYKAVRDVNRAEKRGARLYCNRECAGLGRRNPAPPTDAEKRAAKAEYDREYRNKNRERLKAEKAEYYRRTRDPEKEREYRKSRMPYHVEYCRRPEYKEWKSQYDRKHRARKWFGDFGEAAIVLNELCSEIATRSTFTERAILKGTLNKRTQRRRDYERQTDRR